MVSGLTCRDMVSGLTCRAQARLARFLRVGDTLVRCVAVDPHDQVYVLADLHVYLFDSVGNLRFSCPVGVRHSLAAGRTFWVLGDRHRVEVRRGAAPPLRQLSGPFQRVTSLAVSKDQHILVADNHYPLREFEAQSGALVRTHATLWQGHAEVAVAGELVVTSDILGVFASTLAGQVLWQLSETPAGLAATAELVFLASDDEPRVDVREAVTGTLVHVLRPTRAASRGGWCVAAGLHRVAVCGWRAGQVQLWE